MVRLTDCPDMNIGVYRGRKTTLQLIHITTFPFTVWKPVNTLFISQHMIPPSSTGVSKYISYIRTVDSLEILDVKFIQSSR